MHAGLHVTSHHCLILIKIGICQHMLVKLANNDFCFLLTITDSTVEESLSINNTGFHIT
jgi:hypothetical protein